MSEAASARGGARTEVVNVSLALRQAVRDGVVVKRHALAIMPNHSPTRAHHRTGWVVHSPFFDTDPEAHWSDHRRKAFGEFGLEGSAREAREAARLLAVAWVKATYGYDGAWVRMGGEWVPAAVGAAYVLRRS